MTEYTEGSKLGTDTLVHLTTCMELLSVTVSSNGKRFPDDIPLSDEGGARFAATYSTETLHCYQNVFKGTLCNISYNE